MRHYTGINRTGFKNSARRGDLFDIHHTFHELLRERSTGERHAHIAGEFQCGYQALREDLQALISRRFGLARPLEPTQPMIQDETLAGADMQHPLKRLKIQSGLVAKQLALMSGDHVQTDHDLNEHLRHGARAQFTEMKNMAGGGLKNRPAFFQNLRFPTHHIAELSVFGAFLTAADRRVDHFDAFVASP